MNGAEGNRHAAAKLQLQPQSNPAAVMAAA